MSTQRLIAAAAAFLFLLLLAGLLFERAATKDRNEPAPTPTTLSSPTPTPGAVSVGTATPAVRHRVAGIAVGDVHFVVVEHPDGTSALYRPGSEVPGLGRVRDITEGGATFDTPTGPLMLPITAPPPSTPAPLLPSVTTTPQRPPATPTHPPRRGRTARGSSP